MQNLQVLIDMLTKGRKLHISILDLNGILNTPSTRVCFENVIHSKKICDIAAMALKAKAPIVSMLDSCGIRLHEGVDALAGYGKIISAFNASSRQIS